MVLAFACRCGSPPVTWEDVARVVADSRKDPAAVLLLGGCCLNSLQQQRADQKYHIQQLENCFELVADRSLIAAELAQQSYLVTPGWLEGWQAQLQLWGFDQETARLFFHDSCKQITLLDTGTSSSAATELEAFGRYVDLPVRQHSLPPNLLRLHAERYLEQARRIAAEQALQQQERRVSDYAMALDMMQQIARSMHEEEVIRQGLQLYQMLYAATEVCFIPLSPEGRPVMPISSGFSLPADSERIRSAACSLTAAYQLLPGGCGFMLRVEHGEQQLGVLWIDGIPLPEYLNQYLGLALDTVAIWGMGLCNARSFRQLREQHTELEQLHLQLFQQEKLASIGQLAAGVAHEINNPMGFITSNLGSLQKYTERLTAYTALLQQTLQQELPPERQAELEAQRKQHKIDRILADTGQLIQESLEGAERVRVIVTDLKNFARVEPKQLMSTNLTYCIEVALNLLRTKYEYHATLKLELEPQLPELQANAQQLVQVVLNLVVNGIHALHEEQGTITVRSWKEPEAVCFSVADTGCGMSPETQRRIFEPFFTTKEVGKGTGLGLSICYDSIKKHGGEITVESIAGKGTTFTVRLPVAGLEQSGDQL